MTSSCPAAPNVCPPGWPAVGSNSPPNDPLLKLPNAIVAPHIASATVQTRNAMAEICAGNLIAGVTGQPLQAWVNPEVEGKRRR